MMLKMNSYTVTIGDVIRFVGVSNFKNPAFCASDVDPLELTS